MSNLNIVQQGTGKALVFFHGWGFDHQVWLPLVENLAQDYTCYLVDLPGFGSSLPMDWLQFKKALMAKVSLPFAVIGWSMGGLWATRLATEAEDTVQSLINVASSPCFLAEKEWPGIDSAAFRAFSLQLRRNPAEMIAKFAGKKGRSVLAIPPLTHLKAGLSVLADWDLREALGSLRKPAAYFWGRLDAIVPIALMSTMQHRYPQFAHVIFEGSAHLPFLSEKDKFLRALRQQLSVCH